MDPNDPYNSMLEWSKRALAMKQMNKQIRSAGEQPQGTASNSRAPKGSRENPWDWWESDGDNVRSGDYVYERPVEKGNLGTSLEGTKGQGWRSMDAWREQQARDLSNAPRKPEMSVQAPTIGAGTTSTDRALPISRGPSFQRPDYDPARNPLPRLYGEGDGSGQGDLSPENKPKFPGEMVDFNQPLRNSMLPNYGVPPRRRG